MAGGTVPGMEVWVNSYDTMAGGMVQHGTNTTNANRRADDPCIGRQHVFFLFSFFSRGLGGREGYVRLKKLSLYL